jgi:triacylglycerol lipase
MSIMDSQSVSFGLLAMYTEDMYDAAVGSLNPAADPRITASGWTIVGYLTALDALIPAKNASRQRLSIDGAKRVFFGVLAQNNTDPTSYVAIVRGTEGIVEWVIDAEFLLIPHPRYADVHVEQGFWNIYQTMSLADPATGLTTHQNAAEGVAEVVREGTVVVTGHSLGSALATYFADDLAERLGSRASACLFASPRTGDSAWANLFATNVKEYRLFNYILDIVTHVPTLGYATLPNATVIQPSTAQAGVRLDVLCDHHVICYCAMIGYRDTMVATTPTLPQDASCKSCILAPPSAMPESAKALATIINEFGVGDERSLVMLKALHTVNTI